MKASDIFRVVGKELGFGEVSLDFRPYSELKHTWRVDGKCLEITISDYLQNAPEDVMESLAWYLASRAAGRRCPRGKADAYLYYARSRDLWSQNREIYLARSKDLSLTPSGAHRDLVAIFDYVNSFYFSGRLSRPTLAWTCESPSRRLGFLFEALDLLAVNKVLDSESVPRHVLEFVMYHELLHHVNALDARPVRRVHHTKKFREQERLFRTYEEAEVWLRRLVFEHRKRR
ncbi:MAG: M48 family metallopeptidase [Candidatus Thermoplasmatota archaeon]|nr:M48 family metallopeptidase [Candidatus Thermoplasmatota archaeon]